MDEMETKTYIGGKRTRGRSRGVKRNKWRNRRGQSVEQKNEGSNSTITLSNMYKNPVPKIKKINLRYFERAFDLNPGIGGIPGTHVFSANGIYDPDITGVGGQPLGFDQYMAMYDHYTVIASSITVFARNAEGSYAQFFGIKLSDRATVNTDYSNIIENGYCAYRLLGPSGASNAIGSVSFGANPSKFLGRPQIMSEDELRGSQTSNPAEQCYFHVFAFPDTSVDSAAVRVTVQIDYVAILTEPKELVSS